MKVEREINIIATTILADDNEVTGEQINTVLPTVDGVNVVPVGSELVDVDHASKHVSLAVFSMQTGQLLTCYVRR